MSLLFNFPQGKNAVTTPRWQPVTAQKLRYCFYSWPLIILLLLSSRLSQAQVYQGDELWIQNQADLNNFNYTEVTGSLYIYVTSDITDLKPLAKLTKVGGGFYLSYNDNLSSLVGLEKLTSVGGPFYISNNPKLRSLAGLENLTRAGHLHIEDNAELSSLTNLEKLTAVGNLYVKSNSNLRNLAGLENLASIGGQLQIQFNPVLSSLAGLKSLTSVGEDLSITYNSALSSLTGLENLTSVKTGVVIGSNEELSSVEALKNLTSIGQSTFIEDNSKLTQCCQLLSIIRATKGKTVIQRNATNCNSKAEIEAACAPVTITTQPKDVAVCTGEKATFRVEASGTGLSYQWKKGETPIPNATSNTYSLEAVSPAHAGTYSVVVTRGTSSVSSTAANLTVNTVPAISAQPVAITKCVGQAAVFSVTATGSNLRYQWQKDEADIPNATNASYQLSSVSAAQAGSYRVKITGDCGTTSSEAATLMINAVPVIIDQPVSATVCAGTTAIFSVVVTGTSESNIKWQMSTDRGASWREVKSGASSVSISNTTVAMSGNYQFRALVLNECNPVTSNVATLTVTPALIITSQPVPVTKCTEDAASFSVTATGSNLRYQWQKNGEDIADATQASYHLSSVSAAQAGNYRVAITGECGQVTSEVVSLTVSVRPIITTQPVAALTCSGEFVSFTVEATGDQLSYQWQKNGTNIPDATSATYTIASVSTTDAADYLVKVTNTCGSVTSQKTNLTVKPALVLGTFSAPTAPVPLNTSFSLSVPFSGSTVNSATWNWGDGSTSPATTSGNTLQGSHKYTKPGTYSPVLTVTDACGQTTQATYEYVVVYEASTGCITGAGGFTSPKQAYKADSKLMGPAVFGLYARYKKGTNTPEGSTLFAFKAGKVKMAFASTLYESLTISSGKARYTGKGKINGQGNYGFLVSLLDGRPDKFRIKIWNKEKSNTVVYDNNLNSTADAADPTTVITGFILVQTSKAAVARMSLPGVEAALEKEFSPAFRNYPNPFSNQTTLEFTFEQDEEYTVAIYDLAGKLVSQLPGGKAKAGEPVQVEWKAGPYPTGVYLARLSSRQGIRYLKLVIQ
ncbi:T9SS type A sorting domain-containing protein [Adhaeribacter arboris]|nr:T9SS type A sorting domain-containing protein [Adhaeribacter arboris]